MSDIPTYSAMANWARVAAGFKGGPFMKNPSMTPRRTFVDGWPDGVAEKMGWKSFPQPMPDDVWNMRRSNGNK